MGAAKKQEIQFREMSVAELNTAVLAAVSAGSFDEAVDILHAFLNQPSPYPRFKVEMERIVLHCVDLVNAIRAKKSFPGMSSLTRAKQRDLSDRANEHFTELQSTIAKMHKKVGRLTNEDARSTLWVVRASFYALVFMAIVSFVVELFGGFAAVIETVLDGYILKGVDWLMRLVGK